MVIGGMRWPDSRLSWGGFNESLTEVGHSLIDRRKNLKIGAGTVDEWKRSVGGGSEDFGETSGNRLLGEEVIEGFYGGEFILFDIENGIELGDVEDVANFFGEVEKFEFAARVAYGCEAAD